MCLKIYEKLKLGILLQKTNTTLIAFGNNKLKPVGAITVPTESNKIRENLKFCVMDAVDTAILGTSACEAFKLIQRVTITAALDSKAHKPGSLTKSDITEDLKDVFSGLGEYEREYHIETKAEATPVVQPARKIPGLESIQIGIELNQNGWNWN